MILNGSAYLYNVACIRYLGSRVYGDVAAMLALFALVSLPLGSIQTLLAREVAQLQDRRGIAALLRRNTFRGAILGAAFLVVGLILVDPIRDALNIAERSTVVAGVSAIPFAILAAILFGFLQGQLRFSALSMVYCLGGLARPVLVVPALLLGLGGYRGARREHRCGPDRRLTCGVRSPRSLGPSQCG